MDSTSPGISPLWTLLFTLGLASGCATLSESQCAANDWQTVGYSDAASGQDSSRLLKHQNACMKHGVPPDRDQYMIGWEQGIVRYCTPENGFQQGQRGAGYKNVCPDHLEPSFHDAYASGRELYLAQAEINQLKRSIQSKSRRLEQVEEDLRDTEARLVSDSASQVDRMRWLDETKALAREQGQLSSEITDLKVQAAVKKDRLEALRHTLAVNY